MYLKNRNIVLTGGGRGIGREIAIKLASEGASLILISRTESELKETLSIISIISPSSFYMVSNISDHESIQVTFQKIFDKTGGIDCLINNAGIQAPIGPFNKTDVREWKKNYEINLFGTVNCTSAALQKMIERKKGKIVNMSGGGSTSARKNFSAYGISKTAIVRFTETLAEEVKEFNIDINAVSPGAVNTRMLDEVISAEQDAGEEYKDAVQRKENNSGSDPKIAAKLICFLCSDDSDGITGKLISAQWDQWETKEFQELLKNDKDFATLRRIDNKTFYKNNI